LCQAVYLISKQQNQELYMNGKNDHDGIHLRGNALYTLLIASVLFSIPLSSGARQVALTRSVIEAHQVTSVEAYGKYAVVQLPITNGVALWNPVAITKNSDGVIYVANYVGEVYSLHDTNGDGLEDEARLFCDVTDDKLRYPTSILFKGDDLYVACTQEIRIYTDSDHEGKADRSRTFFNDMPWNLDPECWTFGLCFGPDGWLYCNLTTDSYSKRADDPKKMRGAVLRIAPDGQTCEIFATGIRFAPGMAFNSHGDLFLSDNKGNENDTEEINHIEKGKFYGNNPRKYTNQVEVGPILSVKHGNAMGGIRFNHHNDNFPGTSGDLFAACWGSNGQWSKGELIRARLSRGENGNYFAKEFPVIKQLGKIIDIEFSTNGDLYIAQFGREHNTSGKGWHFPWPEPEGGIFRMVPAPWVTPVATQQRQKTQGDLAKGKAHYTQRACATCHAVDGVTDSFGPNMKDIGLVFNSEELLNQIIDPASAIQVGYETQLITKNDGSTLIGRITHSDKKSITLLMAGDVSMTIPRNDISSMKTEKGSMMPAGLLSGLSKSDINDLLAYIENLGFYGDDEDHGEYIVFNGNKGPGKGKHIVFVTGDEEYRSEECMPMLAALLSKRYGFKCTVLFAINKQTGDIDPNVKGNIPGLEALATADLMFVYTRFRDLPDEQMKHIDSYLQTGKPIVGIRPSVVAFRNKPSSNYARYSDQYRGDDYKDGFGRQVLGATWISHHGHHGVESTLGIPVEGLRTHPIMRGVGKMWGPTDVYTVSSPIPHKGTVLVMGQVLRGMKGTEYSPKEQMPLAWVKEYPTPNGEARVFMSTMGDAQDFLDESFRRMVVNACFWAMKMETSIGKETNVDFMGSYHPSPFGFNGFRKGLKPAHYLQTPDG
jgi:putative heme-binding domain-containing protein